MWVFVVVLQDQVIYCLYVPYQYQKHKNKLQKNVRLRSFLIFGRL
jgi:hypothetical protein